MYYYRARWYDANVGRFISQDPKGFDAGDANLYRYVGNSSPNAEDPSGMLVNNAPGPIAVQSNSPAQLVNQRLLPSMDSIVRSNNSVWDEAKGRIAKDFGLHPGTAWDAPIGSTTYGSLVTGEYNAKVGWYANRNIQIANTPEEAKRIYNQQVVGSVEAGAWDYTVETTKGFGAGTVRGITNVGVGTAKAVREVGYQAADFANTTGYLVTGHEMYHGNLSDLGKASVRDDFAYGQHVAETSANFVTGGVYGEAKLTYLYSTGQIDLDTYSQGMGATGVFQVAPGVGKYGGNLARSAGRSIALRLALEATPTDALPVTMGQRGPLVQEVSQVQLNRGAGNAWKEVVAKNFPGAEQEVRVAGFMDNGKLASNYMVADIIARDSMNMQGVVEAKLNPSSPLTLRQSQHIPLIQRNGGIITSTGEFIPPGRVNVIRGPQIR